MRSWTTSILRGSLLSAVAAVAITCAGVGPVSAAEGETALPSQRWSFDGFFGTFDRASVQRGFQVYREVCASCHALDFVAFRNLEHLGYNEDEVKAVAASYTVEDGPNDEGEMFQRPATPADRFPAPFPNEAAARFANNGAAPPDLSVMAKARTGGPDYLFAFLTGFEEPPADVELMPGMNYNPYFPGHQTAMPAILAEGGVQYSDGTDATVGQQARDVANFLMWTAEPHLEERKGMGAKVILFLIVLTGLLYASKRKIWMTVEH